MRKVSKPTRASTLASTLVPTLAAALTLAFTCALILACATALAIACPATALANSAQTQWEGVTSMGPLTADEDCPIVVDREVLTFDIREFPLEHYENPDDLLAYTPSVTAEYTFRNPADYAVRATLVFPFGNLPDYADAFAGYDLQEGERAKLSLAQYGASIDGEPAQIYEPGPDEPIDPPDVPPEPGPYDPPMAPPGSCPDDPSILPPDDPVSGHVKYYVSGV